MRGYAGMADGEVDLDTERGRQVWTLMKRRSIGFSFAYMIPAGGAFKRADGIREIHKLDVFAVTATGSPREFILPAIAKGTKWKLFVDSAADSPKDVYPQQDGPAPPRSGKLTLDYRSLMVFVEV